MLVIIVLKSMNQSDKDKSIFTVHLYGSVGSNLISICVLQ